MLAPANQAAEGVEEQPTEQLDEAAALKDAALELSEKQRKASEAIARKKRIMSIMASAQKIFLKNHGTQYIVSTAEHSRHTVYSKYRRALTALST